MTSLKKVKVRFKKSKWNSVNGERLGKISAKCEELENVGKLPLSTTTERSTSRRNLKMLQN